MQVSLVMFKTDGSRREFPMTRDRMVVGRKNNCDLRIPLSSVSRQHCEVRIEGDEVKLRDLGSSNGTYHNSIRVQEATLSRGDEIVIGPVVFTVVIDGEPSEIHPVKSMVGGASAEGTGGEITAPSADPADAEEAELLEIEPDLSLPEVEAETQSPTVDLDDDPIAALERLAEAERMAGTASGVELELDFDDELRLEDDEDDDQK